MNSSEDKSFKDCSFAKVQKIVSGKWDMLIIYLLSKETLRFGELHRKLPDMTQATLSKQLKSLEGYGIVNRNVYNQIPPKVEYSLTEIGVKFLPVLQALEEWSKEYEKYSYNSMN
ncbi:winged helix-turn-helix transcriptional regulator [Clostridium botulinum]|jgi:DNA-binding HxlR family transcriptional regulator|uniref:winged helix-turn-helix transcriptional regulator n=1 Tax=Clostridium TaxID=1485 RepID=UPI00077319AD|nr:helix-turn-helix domain-containing protein [Clostridium botulinum]MBY6930439.1 helix-turn-helix transcriptional regulator [Clostridium botulinum]NFG19401.1 helix-turn-helix transcriptional regulator [Clostridium botulinum]NFL87887.1 helix-turn-helix transcriptional regulator [Clostridium botulinum]NFO22523.1 helix-turn-helix transcriptional regulator [Clostridium botulinum]NFO79494.1 helix-turn-helix transcriptional regulator [Clostridium botulinum]